MKIRLFVCVVCLGMFFVACSKKVDEYDKPAMYWYEEIFKEIRYGNLETADTKFASLQSEHVNSPLVPEAMLALGHAHMAQDEFLLAEFYFDEYLKRFSNRANYSYINYLKILARYYSFKNHSKDQQFMMDSMVEIQNYLDAYPDEIYTPYVAYILTKFKLGQAELNSAIANVYQKENKKYAAKLYLDRNDEDLRKNFRNVTNGVPWYVMEALEIKKIDYILPSYKPWYVMIFNW
ncbi:outer membrane protein assembly factor BamD [Helicobacter pametensis]|uniref:outer membrane protein assembly factor BamD n=1 Tax=Helicobacter pametensis TaxID=95149 RepID=UPI0009FBC4E2|nr:outer membrane protein assembly factor BamD [Helicobacter pametensis]